LFLQKQNFPNHQYSWIFNIINYYMLYF